MKKRSSTILIVLFFLLIGTSAIRAAEKSPAQTIWENYLETAQPNNSPVHGYVQLGTFNGFVRHGNGNEQPIDWDNYTLKLALVPVRNLEISGNWGSNVETIATGDSFLIYCAALKYQFYQKNGWTLAAKAFTTDYISIDQQIPDAEKGSGFTLFVNKVLNEQLTLYQNYNLTIIPEASGSVTNGLLYNINKNSAVKAMIRIRPVGMFSHMFFTGLLYKHKFSDNLVYLGEAFKTPDNHFGLTNTLQTSLGSNIFLTGQLILNTDPTQYNKFKSDMQIAAGPCSFDLGLENSFASSFHYWNSYHAGFDLSLFKHIIWTNYGFRTYNENSTTFGLLSGFRYDL